MTNTKKQNWFINFIQAFSSKYDDDLSEEKLSSEDRELLKKIRGMDKVSKVEEDMRKKYGATVNTTAAIKKADGKRKLDKKEEKSIDTK